MPAEHLRALIHQLHPGASVKQLTEAAGVPNNRLAHWTRPSTEIDGVPKTDICKEIARILRCDLIDVVEAFAADAGLPWGPDPGLDSEVKRLARVTGVDFDVLYEVANDAQARQLIRDRRRVAPDRRDTLNMMALSLAGGPPRGPSRTPPEPPAVDDEVDSEAHILRRARTRGVKASGLATEDGQRAH